MGEVTNMMWCMKRANKIIKRSSIQENEDGATAIEFALISIPLFWMLMGIIEFGLIMFATNVVETATNAGARLGITGSNYADTIYDSRYANPDDNLTREYIIRRTMEQMSAGILRGENLDIQCRSLGQVSRFGTREVSGDSGCSAVNLGEGGESVIFNTSYRWELFTPLISAFFGAEDGATGSVLIQSTALVRNEEFD